MRMNRYAFSVDGHSRRVKMAKSSGVCADSSSIPETSGELKSNASHLTRTNAGEGPRVEAEGPRSEPKVTRRNLLSPSSDRYLA